MARKLLNNSLVTYPKRIIFREPDKQNLSWYELLLKVVAIQILSAGLGAITSGLASGILQGIGASQFIIGTTKTIVVSITDFLIAQVNDALNENISLKNSLLNLAMSFNSFGKLGRGIKSEKILKIANEQGIFQQMGLTFKAKNFWEVQQKLKLTNIITKHKVVLNFGKKVTEDQLLQSIALIASGTLRKELKRLTGKEIQQLLLLEKTLGKLNSKLIPKFSKVDEIKYNSYLKTAANISLEDFAKLNDYDSIAIISSLAKNTKIGNETILKINQYRLTSIFQNNLLELFIKGKKQLKNFTKKVNIFWWLEKAINKMLHPINSTFNNVGNEIAKKITSLAKDQFKKIIDATWIPCRENSYLQSFKFELIGMSGEGILEIAKKPYVSTKTGKVSNYNNVRIYTTVLQVKEFSMTSHQNTYYADNWALGKGYQQGEFKFLKFLSPKISSIFTDNIKFYSNVKALALFLKYGNFNDYFEMKSLKIYNKAIKKSINSILGIMPGLKMFHPALWDLINRHKFKNGRIIKITGSRISKSSNKRIKRL